MASTLPVAFDQCGVSLRGGVDLVGFEFAAGLLLIRSIGTSADHVCNVLLRAALHTNGTEIHVHTKNFGRGQRAGDLLGPGITVAENPHLLRSCDRNEKCCRDQHSRDLCELLDHGVVADSSGSSESHEVGAYLLCWGAEAPEYLC